MALHLKDTGIDFADFGDSTAAGELLDDYEQGAWTAGTGTSTWSNTVTNQYYVKVGDMFTLHVYLQLSSGTGTQMQVNGMPFAVGAYGSSSAINHGSSASGAFNYRWDIGSDTMNLHDSAGTGDGQGADAADQTHQMYTYTARIA